MYYTDDFMIAWTPEEIVRVGPWPDTDGWSAGLDKTVGACLAYWDGLSDADRRRKLIEWAHDVIKDGIGVSMMCAQFAKIEYWDEAEFEKHRVFPKYRTHTVECADAEVAKTELEKCLNAGAEVGYELLTLTSANSPHTGLVYTAVMVWKNPNQSQHIT